MAMVMVKMMIHIVVTTFIVVLLTAVTTVTVVPMLVDGTSRILEELERS